LLLPWLTFDPENGGDYPPKLRVISELHGVRSKKHVFLIATQREDVWERGAEGNIWSKEGPTNREMVKLHDEKLHSSYTSP
jgi:hypothetical protein